MFTVFSDFSTQGSSGEFLASLGLWEEKTHSNLCTYVIVLSWLRASIQGFRSVGSLAKTNIWSPQRARLRHSVGNYLRAIPTIPPLGHKLRCSRSRFLAQYCFFFLLFSESARLPAPWFKARPPSQCPEAGSGPSLIQEGPPGSCAAACWHVTNDKWHSCRGSPASLCLLRSRNTFASDARSPETLQSAPTD